MFKVLFSGVLLSITFFVNAADNQTPLTFEQEQELKQRASSQALESLYVNPEFIKEGIEKQETQDKAQMEAIKPPSDRRVKTITVRPNDKDLYEVRVFPNQVTTVILTDNFGEAWPLKTAPIVATNSYSVAYNPEIPGIFTIQTTEKFVPSSLTLILQGRLRPIQFMLNSDNDYYNYTVDLQIVGISPTNEAAKVSRYDGYQIPEASNQGLDQFLSNPPADAQKLETIGSNRVSVWRWQGGIVVRSIYTLIDPAPSPHISSNIDSDEKVYILNQSVELLTLLNEETGDAVQVEVIGGMNGG